MTDRIFAGTSVFFANRAGNHNWLDNNKRPMVTITTTDLTGTRSYVDAFVGKDVAVKETKDSVVLTIPKTISTPVFRFLVKSQS